MLVERMKKMKKLEMFKSKHIHAVTGLDEKDCGSTKKH